MVRNWPRRMPHRDCWGRTENHCKKQQNKNEKQETRKMNVVVDKRIDLSHPEETVLSKNTIHSNDKAHPSNWREPTDGPSEFSNKIKCVLIPSLVVLSWI
mmetsp:Transcript_27970/g.58588  ORF Transcript_27970/g.58588 Transcript_27970/m.58588 type:complete len:100 (-) Transcript_27970:71-370(-)